MLLTVADTGNADKPFVLLSGGNFSEDQMAVSKKGMKQKAVVAQMPVRRWQEAKIFQFHAHAADILIGKRPDEW